MALNIYRYSAPGRLIGQSALRLRIEINNARIIGLKTVGGVGVEKAFTVFEGVYKGVHRGAGLQDARGVL